MFKSTVAATTLILALASAPALAQGQSGNAGGNNAQQEGLVNVAVGDIGVDALNGTQVQVPIGIAAQVCGVNANVIAEQGDTALEDCEVTQETANEAFLNFVQKK